MKNIEGKHGVNSAQLEPGSGRVTWGKMTTGVRCPFIVLQLPPAGSCVCIFCTFFFDNPRHLSSQQRQSLLSDKIFFSFTPSHLRNGPNVSIMYYFEKVSGNHGTFQLNSYMTLLDIKGFQVWQ